MTLYCSEQSISVNLILGVCILLRVLDQGEGFPSMQRYTMVLLFIHLSAACFGRTTIFRKKYIYICRKLQYWQRIRCFWILINVMDNNSDRFCGCCAASTVANCCVLDAVCSRLSLRAAVPNVLQPDVLILMCSCWFAIVNQHSNHISYSLLLSITLTNILKTTDPFWVV
jgi:lipoprotein signal peptidase